MQTELSQISNQILGLATQVENLKAYQEQVSSHIQSTSKQMESIERVARGTNLAMEGIARKTDDSHEYLHLLEQSVTQLQETQLNTNSLREGVHQLISDSFMRLQRYLELRYPSGQPLDLRQVRVEAQHEVAADLLRKLEEILNHSGENSGYHQASAGPNLQHHAALLQQEIAILSTRQAKTLHLLDSLRQDTPIFRRLVFPVIEQQKREELINELVQLIKPSSQNKQNPDLADNLSQYIHEVNAMLDELKDLRTQLLDLLTQTKSTTDAGDSDILNVNAVDIQMATSFMPKPDEEEEEDDEDEDEEVVQVNEAELLFKSDQT